METKTREDIIKSISNIAKDYREGAIMNEQHVEEWVLQFNKQDQLTILLEMEYILQNFYVSKKMAYSYLEGLLEVKEIVGEDFLQNYKRIKFLNIQNLGYSQKDLLKLMNDILNQKYGLSIEECGSDSPDIYFYLDDCLFSGNRVYRDIERWIGEAKPSSQLHLAFFGLHTSNFDFRYRQINELCASKNIKVTFWRYKQINNIIWGDKYDCCWPSNLINYHQDVYNFVDSLDEQRTEKQRANIPLFRNDSKSFADSLFTSKEGRNLVEKAFLEKGTYIYNLSINKSMKPLGYDYSPTLGFGSLFITYRNIANNCPLVLWWGDKTKPHPINQWYPLFPRTVNNE